MRAPFIGLVLLLVWGAILIATPRGLVGNSALLVGLVALCYGSDWAHRRAHRRKTR